MEVKAEVRDPKVFMSVEVVLGLFILYPHLRKYLEELILPESDFALCLYGALKEAPEGPTLTEEMLNIPEEHRERTKILQLYCENHFMGWSDTLAIQEICSNCSQANRETLRLKQRELSQKLLQAHREGKNAEAAQLSTQYQQILKLAKMAS